VLGRDFAGASFQDLQNAEEEPIELRIGSDWRFTVEAIDKWRAAAESGAPASRD